MKVVALAGGIGAGKFLRGMTRVLPADDLTVILNVADDIVVHGLHVSPDPDSVTYWLGDAFDRERGWGRRDESFRATEELRAFGAADAWFNLGDLDLATHVLRTSMLHQGATMSQVVARVAERFGIGARLLPVTDPAFRAKVESLAQSIEATRVVQPVRTFYSTGDRQLVSPNRHATILLVGMLGDGDDGIEQVIDAVDAGSSGGFDTTITGQYTADHDFTRLSQEDLEQGELEFGLPVALMSLALSTVYLYARYLL